MSTVSTLQNPYKALILTVQALIVRLSANHLTILELLVRFSAHHHTILELLAVSGTACALCQDPVIEDDHSHDPTSNVVWSQHDFSSLGHTSQCCRERHTWSHTCTGVCPSSANHPMNDCVKQVTQVVDVCRAANPRLAIRRARFSSVIPREIHAAICHMAPPNEAQSLCVDTRQEIDLRVGAAFTRFQTLLLQVGDGWDQGAETQLSRRCSMSVVDCSWQMQAVKQPGSVWNLRVVN